MDDDGNAKWPEDRVNGVDELHQKIAELRERISNLKSKTDSRPEGGWPIAWSGRARSEWKLESTLDRHLKKVAPKESYEQWLGREQAINAEFVQRARQYASEIERQYLSNIWTALAFGRHARLPTRLLDWTRSPWAAVWFACVEHSDADGALWWFDLTEFVKQVGPNWDEWGVPLRPGQPHPKGDRDFEATAFETHCKPWVCQLRYFYPCSRMAAQQGFLSVCGRLRKTHNDAIDEMPNGGTIKRGRIIIPAGIKGKVCEELRQMNIHATSLEYPGVDIVVQEILEEQLRNSKA